MCDTSSHDAYTPYAPLHRPHRRYLSYDMGTTWQRPQCTYTNQCFNPLFTPDTKGWCLAASNYDQHCYVLPDAPVLPGGLGADWDNCAYPK